MAKQKGILPLVGTIGSINFYYLNGKPVARIAGGGFNREAIKTKKRMQRVRENGSEFGHCSVVNKVFRQALRPFYKGYKFTFLHSRLMRLFTGLKGLDAVHLRGQRVVFEGVATDRGLAMLKQFDYTPDCNVRRVLPFNFAVAPSNQALTISGIDIKRVGFITGATHIELTYGILDFNFETLDKEPHLATPLILNKDFADHSVTLVPTTLPTGIGTVLCVLGVRFHQEIDDRLYVLNAKNGVGFGMV
jgi:hypothetical protein